jgi:hypothetical protein
MVALPVSYDNNLARAEHSKGTEFSHFCRNACPQPAPYFGGAGRYGGQAQNNTRALKKRAARRRSGNFSESDTEPVVSAPVDAVGLPKPLFGTTHG